MCQSLFFFFFKKQTLAQVFSCEFFEISKNTFFTEHIRMTASKMPWMENTFTKVQTASLQ